ncbi:MAG: GNAT family N-acetyltransferase [Acidiferrobacterales bacterium]
MATIREASAEDTDAVRCLFQEYAAWLGIDLSFQSFHEELESLPSPYVRPRGFVLLAESEERAVGCVALRKLSGGIAEAKRLYVVPAHRGRGIGRRLMEEVIREACRIGYTAIRLDTLPQMKTASALYEALGFKRIGPYYYNPIAGTTYMELSLT